jgi:putative nucleotidyltransferase with HDIG domain
MSRSKSRLSIFAQPIDRAASVAYFLGAVVPLGALAWLVLQKLRPTAAEIDADWIVVTLGLIGLLSLLSFFVLRRVAQTALRIMDRENASLSHLLAASRTLAAATEAHEVLSLAAEAAAKVTFARGGYVLARNRVGDLEVRERHADDEDNAVRSAALIEAAEESLLGLKPAARGISPEGGGGIAVAVPCSTGERMTGVLAVWQPDAEALEPAELDTLSTLGSLVTIALRNADLREAERNFFTHATNLLVATLDLYLGDRADHSRRVAGIANQIAHEMKLSDSRRERMHFAALLHDIGMLRVRREHVGDLEMIRRHAELGDEMLRPIRVWEDLAPLVRHHHEWYDGRGYPDGLAGDKIPLESRIIAVAEAFDAMTSEKSYQHAIPVGEALDRIEQASGSQFDPDVVAAFLQHRREAEAV